MLQIKNLSFGFKEKNHDYLIKNLSFKVNNGEIKLIFGKSGLGKSTLLNIITGIEIENLFWSGEIFLDQQKINIIPLEKRKIGLLMQERFLFPHFRVKDNLYCNISGVRNWEYKLWPVLMWQQCNLSIKTHSQR